MFLRQKLLETALKQVNHIGWSDELLVQAVKHHSLSPAVTRGLFPDGVTEVIQHLMKRWEEQLSLEAVALQLESLPLNEKLYILLKKRLEYEIPYMPRWREAMCIGMQPSNIMSTTDSLNSLMNTIWTLVEDEHLSVNYN